MAWPWHGHGGTKDLGILLAAAGCCSAHPAGASSPGAALEGVVAQALRPLRRGHGVAMAINWAQIDVDSWILQMLPRAISGLKV